MFHEILDSKSGLTEDQIKAFDESRGMVPDSISDAQLRSIILSCNGDRAKLNLRIQDLWNECDNESEWQEVTSKSIRTKKEKKSTDNGDNKPSKNISRPAPTNPKARSPSNSSKARYPNHIQNKPRGKKESGGAKSNPRLTSPSSKSNSYNPSEVVSEPAKSDVASRNTVSSVSSGSARSSVPPTSSPSHVSPTSTKSTWSGVPISGPSPQPAPSPKVHKAVDWRHCLKSNPEPAPSAQQPMPALHLTPRSAKSQVIHHSDPQPTPSAQPNTSSIQFTPHRLEGFTQPDAGAVFLTESMPSSINNTNNQTQNTGFSNGGQSLPKEENGTTTPEYLDQLKPMDAATEAGIYSGYDMVYGYPAFDYSQMPMGGGMQMPMAAGMQMSQPSMGDGNMMYYTGSYPYYGVVYDQTQYAGWQGYAGYSTPNPSNREETN